MEQFDIIDYLSGVAGTYVFDRSALVAIARDRNVLNVNVYEELDDKIKDLLYADILFKVCTGATSTASISNAHGSYKQAIGSQTVNDKNSIYNIMCSIYKKYDDSKLDIILGNGNDYNLNWVDESSWL